MQCTIGSADLHGNAEWHIQACAKGGCRAVEAVYDQAKLHQAGQAQVLCHRTCGTGQACLRQGVSFSCGLTAALGVKLKFMSC